MNIRLLLIGKTSERYLQDGLDEYCKRLGRFVKYEIDVIADLKNGKSLTQEQVKEGEGRMILERLNSSDTVILLDERGVMMSSLEFSEYIENFALRSVKTLVFVIGGAYGFSKDVYDRAGGKISLSKMTFSHQMVRLIFTEQLYRAYAITAGLPYHHE